MDDIIGKEEKKEQKFEDLYSIEEYFLRKNMYFTLCICSWELQLS